MPTTKRPCDQCGTEYLAKRTTSKYCSAGCRSAAARERRSQAPDAAPEDAAPECTCGRRVTTVEGIVRKQLTEAHRLDTFEGQSALAIAIRIDERQDSGSGLVALVSGLKVAVGVALAGAGPNEPVPDTKPAEVVDPIIVLEERRRERQGRTSG